MTFRMETSVNDSARLRPDGLEAEVYIEVESLSKEQREEALHLLEKLERAADDTLDDYAEG